MDPRAQVFVILLIAICAGLLYMGRGFWAALLAAFGALGLCEYAGVASNATIAAAVLGIALVAILFGVPAIRRWVVSPPIMGVVSRMLPRMGETEAVALAAGTVWWDGELFSGNPAWKKLLEFRIQEPSVKEHAFLTGPVETLCGMLDEWKIEQDGDLPPEIWKFIKENRFLGMIIPEKYGGLGFSAAAHSAVVTKLASRSITAAVTVMVPNSLGPGELLLHYGTDEQKHRYLPRLAAGAEIPCFALTGPEAGSDAAATQSVGVICRGLYEGQEVLGMRLNWRKRYITLGPVSTLIGLAFRLLDPQRLLEGAEDLGITVALIPSNTPGIDIGKRHDPMGIPFQNGPNTGTDVFVPLDFIVGGRAMAGQGWRMLMESLAAGRSISLPALSVGAGELATRIVGAYATVREQFDTPIGRFEGIEEPLARIGGLTYMMNAARVLTAGAVDAGEKPAVISAIVKCYLTEAMRGVVLDAMDIRAGAGVCRGPRNSLARAYMAAPIGITVEGANILTRSMIIYGQGAIRCHPFVRHEMKAIAEKDLVSFDRAFFGHVGFVLQNAARACVFGLTGGYLIAVPARAPVRRYLQRLTRLSTALALISDAAMLTLGGSLKRREKISGRLADALAWMYLACAAIKRFSDTAHNESTLPFMRWSCEHALRQVHDAFAGILENLPNRFAANVLRVLVFPFGVNVRKPSDRLGAEVARALLDDREERLRLTSDIFVPPANEPGLGRLEAALDKAVAAVAIEAKVRDAIRAGRIDRAPGNELLELAQRAGVISADEAARVRDAHEARDEAIQVDAFDAQAFRALQR